MSIPTVSPRPQVGVQPKITDAELLTLAVMQALLGYTSERRWLRQEPDHDGPRPARPTPGYNKRLRKLNGARGWLVATLAAATSVGTDDVWVVDSTPVQ